jgi:hypothetical protein
MRTCHEPGHVAARVSEGAIGLGSASITHLLLACQARHHLNCRKEYSDHPNNEGMRVSNASRACVVNTFGPMGTNTVVECSPRCDLVTCFVGSTFTGLRSLMEPLRIEAQGTFT